MVNINLATDDLSSQGTYSYKRGIVALVAVLIIVALVYVGLVIWQGQLKKQLNKDVVDTIAMQYDQAEQKFSQSGDSKRVLDFQNRIQVASTLLSTEKPILDNLNKIEANMIPSVYFDTFNFDVTNKLMTIDGTANSFNNLAKQILNLKEVKTDKGAEYFTVTTGKTSVDKDGKIKFNLILKQN